MYYTYQEASLVKVIYIYVKDAVFGLYILYQGKLLANYGWIFVFGPLVIVSMRIMCM